MSRVATRNSVVAEERWQEGERERMQQGRRGGRGRGSGDVYFGLLVSPAEKPMHTAAHGATDDL